MARLDRMTRLRAPLVLLLGCALLLRALIPAGWMPTQNGVQLCIDYADGAGARFQQEAQRLLDTALAGTAGHKRGDESRRDLPCAFAGLAIADVPPAGIELAHVSLPAAPAPAPLLSAAIGRGLAAPPPPSTGPPARG